MNDLPIVTVIAVCYNHERFVVECLEGIRNQTYPNIQFIISDDCSTDRSVEVIENWIKDYGVKCHFIKHSQNKGLPKTLNEALKIAEGEYVSLIATDDVWLPDFIQVYLIDLEKRTDDFGLIYGNSFVINEDGQQMAQYRKNEHIHPEGFTLIELLHRPFIATNAVLIKRKYLDLVGGYDESLFFEDFDMWIRLSEVCLFAYSPSVLAKYRIVKSSMSNTKNAEITESLLSTFNRISDSHPELDPLIENRKINRAKDLYRINYPHNNKYLFKYFLRTKKKIYLYYAILSTFHIRFEKSEEIRGFFKS